MGNIVMPAVDSGLLLQRTGKLTIILVLICMIFVIKEPVVTKSVIYKFLRGVSKIQMQWETRNWNEVKGSHFVVRYQPSDRKNAQMVLAVAEKSYVPVSARFSYYPSSKTLIIVYPDKASLGHSFGWAADESAMGVYWAGVIRVLSPNAWVEEKNPDKVEKIFETDGPIAHEYTHMMVDYITGGNYTRWFTEGIAQYEEAKFTGYQMDHRLIKHPDEMYPLATMDSNFDNLADQNLAYFESLQAVNYIVEQYGEGRLREVLKNLGEGYSMDKSFQKALGFSLDQFEKNFKTWVITKS